MKERFTPKQKRNIAIGALGATLLGGAFGLKAAESGNHTTNSKAPVAEATHPIQKPSLSPEAAKQAAFEAAKAKTADSVKVNALAAVDKLLTGLARPDVGAWNYPRTAGEPQQKTIVGNADHSGGTNTPETFVNYDPKAHTVSIGSLSETSVDKSGAPTIAIETFFKLKNDHTLATEAQTNGITVAGVRSQLANPANVELLGAGATLDAATGYGIAMQDGNLFAATGYGAGDTVTDNVGLMQPLTTVEQLTAADNQFASSLAEASNELAHQFTL